MTSEAALIKLENIETTVNPGTADEAKILKGINLEIREGDFICLLGGNGAGKSTLLNVLAGEVSPSKGKIFYKGKDISKESEEKRSRFIARVFQDPKLGTAPRMTVAENLLLAAKRGERRPLKLRKLKSQRAAFAKALVAINNGLEDKLDVPVASSLAASARP